MNTDHHDPLQEPPGDDVLAGEYVLGVLDADARNTVAARLQREAGLAREVTAWQRQLAPMLDDIEAVAPPLSLWPRIREQLGLSATTQPTREVVPLWQRLGFWRGFSAAAFAATAASLVALMLVPRSLPPPASLPHPVKMVVSLQQADGASVFLAAIDNDACTMLVMPMSDRAVPADRVPEFWLIAGDGVPRSLGLTNTIHRAHTLTIPVPLRKASLQPASVVAVSIEPPGGSPTGLPTGAVIAQGGLTSL